MRKWLTTRFQSDLSGIELREVPDAGEPGEGQVRVDVRASGISMADLMLATGTLPGVGENALPRPIGIEFAGTVSAVGAGVSNVAVGDRVCGMILDDESGTACEQVTVPAGEVATLPDALSFAEGAAVPLAYMTAQAVFYRQAALNPGERVLVMSAASGTCLAIAQLAVAAGAEVYGAVSSADKRDAVIAAGAKDVYVYTEDGWEKGMEESFDVVVDPIGGPSYRRSFDLIGPGGRMVALDATSRHPDRPGATDYRRVEGDPLFDPVFDCMYHAKSVIGVYMPQLWPRDGGSGKLLGEALAHFEGGNLRPTVAKSFPFTDLPEAFRFLQGRRNVGRVIVDV